MTPDTARIRQTGIACCALALVAAAALPLLLHDGGEGAAAAAKSAGEARAAAAGTPLLERLAAERQANAGLAKRIDELKQRVGYAPFATFTVPAGTAQPGQYFNERFIAVRQQLRDLAQAKGVDFVESLGFPVDSKVPDDADAPHLLRMLQLTGKAVSIALEAPDPIEWFQIAHGRTEVTGPANRPPLLREYPLTLKVKGSHESVLWIIHRFSQIEETQPGRPADYPLIIRGCTMISPIQDERTGKQLKPVVKGRNGLHLIECELRLAAMEFIPDAERGASPAAASSAAAGAGGAAAGSSRARP